MGAQIILPAVNVGNEIESFAFGQGGTGIKFDVALTEEVRGETHTRWYKIACFGRMVDQAQALIDSGRLATGSKLMIMGAFNPRDYATRNGDTRTSFDVVANTIEVLYFKPQQPQNPLYPDTEGFEYADDDDDAMPSF